MTDKSSISTAHSDASDIDGKEGAARPAAASVEKARAIMLTRAALLLASTLAVAGIFQHAIFRIVVKRRRRVYVERDRAERVVSNAREQTLPEFAASRQNDLERAPVEQIDPRDFAEGIRELVQAMERRAA